MRRVRRNDLSARVEMTPLIDVIFLLLTFFIYSMIIMVHAQVLPVKLVPVNTSKTAKGNSAIAAITIDSAGKLYWNAKRVTSDQLTEHLKKLADQKKPPKLFLALQQDISKNAVAGENFGKLNSSQNFASVPNSATIDRGPVLMRVVEQIRLAGIENFVFVGSPANNGK